MVCLDRSELLLPDWQVGGIWLLCHVVKKVAGGIGFEVVRSDDKDEKRGVLRGVVWACE